MQTQDPLVFTVTDPRTFDGNPYDVAARSMTQVRGIVRVLQTALAPAEVMMRNAQMERQLYHSDGDNAKAHEWEDSPEGRQLKQVVEAVQLLAEDASEIERRLGALAKAAAYDPKG